MNRRPLTVVLVLALLSVTGIVGMLLIDAPAGDAAALMLAAAPVIYGVLRVRPWGSVGRGRRRRHRPPTIPRDPR